MPTKKRKQTTSIPGPELKSPPSTKVTKQGHKSNGDFANGNKYRFDSESARKANKTRWERARENAVEGLKAGADMRNASPGEAWGKLIESQTRLAVEGGRGSTQATRLVGDACGMMPSSVRVSDDNASGMKVLVIAPEMASELLARLERK